MGKMMRPYKDCHTLKEDKGEGVKQAWSGDAGIPDSCSKSQSLCFDQLHWGLLGLVLEGVGTEGSIFSPALSLTV